MSKKKTDPLRKKDPVCQCVRRSLKRYFKDMNGEEPSNVYQMVITEIEKPLLEVVMEQSDSNQTRASRVLGINRNTLRKKLRQYKLE